MNTLNDALKPCPFCGDAEPSFENVDAFWKTVSCSGCGANCGNIHILASDEATIAAWNTRASTPESSAAQGAMGDEREAFASLFHAATPSDAESILKWHDEENDYYFGATKYAFSLFRAIFKAAQPSDATAQPSAEQEFITIADKHGNFIDIAKPKLPSVYSADAERYRVLRNREIEGWYIGPEIETDECGKTLVYHSHFGEELDAVTDAALAAKKG